MNKKKDNLAGVCDKLFYNNNSDLKGNIGIKNLADILSLSDKDFDEYIDKF